MGRLPEVRGVCQYWLRDMNAGHPGTHIRQPQLPETRQRTRSALLSHGRPKRVSQCSFPRAPPNLFEIYLIKKASKSKVGDQKAPFSIATTLQCRGRALFLSLDCFTLSLIHTLYCWVLSKEVSSTIFKVFGITRPWIELRSPGLLANTLPTSPISRWGEYKYRRGIYIWYKYSKINQYARIYIIIKVCWQHGFPKQSDHPSLSAIVFRKSSKRYPVSAQIWWI